ncbi:MAG: nucleotide exchange factor GrpE [bacterium]|nr:nucleotide exchange factor GrpE [bacterium]
MEENNFEKNQVAENPAPISNEETSKKQGGLFKKNPKVEKLKEENGQLLSDLQRTRADFENFRKNVEIRVSNAQILGEKKAILNFLPILDDIERAIAHLPADLAENAWAQNVVKMATNLEKSLANAGVEKIDSSKGAPFNPDFHEAVQFDDDGEGEEIVAEQLRAGYKLKGEVLRAAMVKVGRG